MIIRIAFWGLIMASEKKTLSAGEGILGKNKEKLGNYLEAPGGGTPLKQGEKAPNETWVREHRKMQPRDEDGKFTYNSANLKPLEYGPSRGTTIPPFLRAGVNLDFVATERKTVIMTEEGKRYLLGVSITKEDMIQAYKEYRKTKDEEGFVGLENQLKAKRGRFSKFEREKQLDNATGILKGLDQKEFKEKIKSNFEYKKEIKKSHKRVNMRWFKE